MLKITIPDIEMFDDSTQEFFYKKGCVLQLEHSLVSISKWERKWHKPFISDEKKTSEELKDYIKCMTITQNVDDKIYDYIPSSEIEKITNYINDPMTATWFADDKNKKKSKSVITSERIYYWMIAFNVPSEYRKWHINRLLTLLRVCNIENAPKKKMSKKDIMSRNRALNEARKRKLNTSG